MKAWTIVAVTSLLLGLTSCMTTGYKIITQPPSAPEKTVVIVPAGFGSRSIPAFPLDNAGLYLAGYSSAKQSFLHSESLQATLATTKTVEGFKAAGYRVVVSTTPLTVSLAEQLNPVLFDSPTEWANFAPLVKRESAAAQADYVVVEGWRAVVDSVGALGLSANFYVRGQVAVFAADGSLVGLGLFHSDAGRAGVNDTKAYEIKLSLGEDAKELLIQAFYAVGK